MTADTPADRPAGLAIEVVASLLSELADLRAEVERLTAEAREHVTELNLATINSLHAGEQSKEAELAALRQALADLVAYDDAFREWEKMRPSDRHSKKISQGEKASALLHSAIDKARAALAASAREVTP